MHGQTDYPKNANRKTQKLKSLNGLPHGYRPTYTPILCLALQSGCNHHDN